MSNENLLAAVSFIFEHGCQMDQFEQTNGCGTLTIYRLGTFWVEQTQDQETGEYVFEVWRGIGRSRRRLIGVCYC